MQRVAALFLPQWPIERLRQAEPIATPPEQARKAASLDDLREAAAKEQEHACSVPRGGGWRPGARWAREEQLGRVAALPDARRPARHEVGRREEPAGNPFRALRADDGGSPVILPELVSEFRVGSSPGRSSTIRGMVDPELGTMRSMVEGSPTTIGGLRPPPLHRLRRSPSPSKLGEELRPLVTSHRIGNRVEIAAACPAALAIGLRPGMPLAQARALVAGLDIRPADPAGDLVALHRLGLLAARRWSPLAMLSDEDGLLLEIGATAHLFGGEARMARRILKLLARAGHHGSIAIADTIGAAWALAQFGGKAITLCPPGEQARALTDLPTRALRIDDAAIELLQRLGVDRIGGLAALPRAPLVRRFGTRIALRLDQALGRLPEPFDPIIPPEPIRVERRFAEPILTAEGIAQWLGLLVPELATALEVEGLGARAVEMVANRVDGVPQRIRIGLARPNRDPLHLLRLIARRIETVDPGFGIDAIALHVRRTEPLGPEPMHERLDSEEAPDIATLIDTLATRIGASAMWRSRPVESDVPERSVARARLLDPVDRGGARPKPDDVGQLDRSPALHPWHPEWPKPARLLHRPERLEHVLAELPDHAPRRFTWRGTSHQVVRSDGPERIHGEWWKRAAETHHVRDYFRVEDEQGRRYWLFRRGDGERAVTGDLSWYLHGVFG